MVRCKTWITKKMPESYLIEREGEVVGATGTYSNAVRIARDAANEGDRLAPIVISKNIRVVRCR